MRNSKWNRDEIILVLDTYFRIKPGQINSKNTEIIELSKLLNKLPIYETIPDSVKFRNPNGVSLKLSNFLAIDPNYAGKGMSAFSKLDKEIFDEFSSIKQELNKIATLIKSTIEDKTLNYKLYKIQDEEDEQTQVKEGQVIYKLHKFRGRNPKINRNKKEKYFKENGKLDCEVCGFDFYKTYGEIGKGLIECHHKKPLYDFDGESFTTLDDLALVCSNCHQMLHRSIDIIGIEELQYKIFKKFKP